MKKILKVGDKVREIYRHADFSTDKYFLYPKDEEDKIGILSIYEVDGIILRTFNTELNFLPVHASEYLICTQLSRIRYKIFNPYNEMTLECYARTLSLFLKKEILVKPSEAEVISYEYGLT